jgi:hypothetical protein
MTEREMASGTTVGHTFEGEDSIRTIVTGDETSFRHSDPAKITRVRNNFTYDLPRKMSLQ